IFDAGADDRDRPQDVLVDPASGRVALRAAGTDEEAQQQRRERERHETFRVLYVAASRARDTLLISGSIGRRGPLGWLEQLLTMDLEAPGASGAIAGVSIERRAWRPVATAAVNTPTPRTGLPRSAWLERTF